MKKKRRRKREQKIGRISRVFLRTEKTPRSRYILIKSCSYNSKGKDTPIHLALSLTVLDSWTLIATSPFKKLKPNL